ncbi:MAG: hypothetical protein DRP11_03930 [Candidatus Aenigmatarchaeota archaeon]|nr:MAG: hypothetical protein DRP11_03930 [Candidatus Aenigmarchaeota archaeon]
MTGPGELERRIDRLERLSGGTDPEAEAIVEEAYKRAWARLGATVGPALERFEATGELDPEVENALDTLWDAIHDEARRLASARGVPWDRVLARLLPPSP